jgi:osmotically-inducible protein OsmY
MRSVLFLLASLVAAYNLNPAVTPPAKPAQETRVSDADLEKAINARFADSKIASDKFKAHVQRGVATLEGYTEVIQHKGTATRLAKSAGAMAVINNIEISQAAKDKAQENLESGRRRAQIKRSETTAPRTQH